MERTNTIVIGGISFLAVYILSVGPAAKLHSLGLFPTDAARIVYAPVLFLYELGAGPALDSYMRWWTGGPP